MILCFQKSDSNFVPFLLKRGKLIIIFWPVKYGLSNGEMKE